MLVWKECERVCLCLCVYLCVCVCVHTLTRHCVSSGVRETHRSAFSAVCCDENINVNVIVNVNVNGIEIYAEVSNVSTKGNNKSTKRTAKATRTTSTHQRQQQHRPYAAL
jgi:hypothetical protein